MTHSRKTLGYYRIEIHSGEFLGLTGPLQGSKDKEDRRRSHPVETHTDKGQAAAGRGRSLRHGIGLGRVSGGRGQRGGSAPHSVPR